VTVLGPTAVGIVHVSTGVYSYLWIVAASLAQGSYTIVWSGTYSGATVNATEEIDVIGPSGSQLAPSATPCADWPYVGCDFSQFTDLSVTGVAIAAATEILDAFSGRQFSPCPITIRPCQSSCGDGMWFGAPASWWQWGTWPRPLFYQGSWYNLTCGSCGDNCSCSYISEARMPVPVSAIQQVKVDGVVLPTTAYALRDYRHLMRVDGGIWPLCNDLLKDDNQTGTWSVTLQVGEPVPTLGQLAMGELVCQLMGLLSNGECRLPKPVQSMTRQGVTMNFLDPAEIFPNGQLGLYLCDLFIQSVNPSHLPARAKVYDLDGGDYHIRTGF
jgi:hypothetical protein